MNAFKTLKKIKTLLVDDDELIRDSLKIAFKAKGCALQVAESAEEGLAAVNEESFDIIISDLRLPGINGLDFIKQAAVIQPNAIRFLITAYRDDHIVSEAVRMGIHDFIEKPFSVKKLVNLLELAIKHQEKNHAAVVHKTA